MTIARVYEYGLLPPTVLHDLVLDQMRAAHRYRNVLIEIERERRAAIALALTSHASTEPIAAEIATLATEREALRDRIRAGRAHLRTHAHPEAVTLRDQIRDVARRLRDARARLKEAKRLIGDDAVVRAQIATATERAKVRVREARAACTAYWGTYLLSEQDADAAKKSPTPPSFRPWTGDGRVSVQLQGGIALAEAWGGDTQLQIAPVVYDPHASRGDRRRAARTILRLRVQSDEKGKPVWAEWPLILHRPLPEGCRIKVATVHRRRRDCRRWDWRLTIQVELEDGWTRGRCGEGVVAINLGFCQSYPHLKGALRAGYLVDEHGAEREIVLPRSVIERTEKSESIRSTRDRELDTMRPTLAAWLAERELPPWLAERSQHLHMWRSPARFVGLARAWRLQRWEGDAVGYELIERWRYDDEHLQRYEAGLLRSAQYDRRETYRVIAAELAAKYRVLVVGSTDLREIQRSPQPEEERTEIAVAKRNQRHAAGSILRGVLVNAFRRTGGEVVVINDDRATMTCHACGSIEIWDRIKERAHACGACGALWDQDANHVRNLLTRYRRERLVAAADTEAARVAIPASRKETRTERMRRGKKKPVMDVALENG